MTKASVQIPRNLRESATLADIDSDYYMTHQRQEIGNKTNVSPMKSAAKMHLRSDASEVDEKGENGKT